VIISSQFSEPFSFVVINAKPLKKVVTKKVTKRLDVTIDITLKNDIVQPQDVMSKVTTK